jgi:hypothetical protein
VFLIFDTLNLKWKVIVQKEAQACKVIHEVEDVVLGMQALDEELVTQSSMNQKLFPTNMETKGDEVGVAQVEQATNEAAQVEATYNSEDDLQKTQAFINTL